MADRVGRTERSSQTPRSRDEKLREGIVRWLDRAAHIEETAREARDAWFEHDSHSCSSALGAAMVELMEALDA